MHTLPPGRQLGGHFLLDLKDILEPLRAGCVLPDHWTSSCGGNLTVCGQPQIPCIEEAMAPAGVGGRESACAPVGGLFVTFPAAGQAPHPSALPLAPSWVKATPVKDSMA